MEERLRIIENEAKLAKDEAIMLSIENAQVKKKLLVAEEELMKTKKEAEENDFQNEGKEKSWMMRGNKAEEKVAELSKENDKIKESLLTTKEMLESSEASFKATKDELSRKEEQLLLNIHMAKCEIAEYKEK